jgi:hypothetical protein
LWLSTKVNENLVKLITGPRKEQALNAMLNFFEDVATVYRNGTPFLIS